MSRTTDYNRSDHPNERSDYTERRNYGDDARKDPATLEREIDQTRADMDRTLGALERKLSPGQLLDEGLKLAKEHGGEFFTNFGNSIKQNPMPVILTAVGIGWMFMSTDRSRAATYRGYADPYEASGPSFGRSLSSTAEEKTTEAGERIKAGVQTTRRKLTESSDAMAAGFDRTAEAAHAKVRQAGEGLTHMFEEQPLILGAFGIALGAAIGAALPRSEREDRMFGETRDRTLGNIKQRGAESYDRLKETATQAGKETKQTISRASGETSGTERAQSSPEKTRQGSDS